MIDPNRPYSRLAINKVFTKLKQYMHKEALKRGLAFDDINVALYNDVYTNLIFRGGDNYEYEHLRSSQNVFEKYKHLHTDEDIAKIVNVPENVGITSFEINRHKDKYAMETRILNDSNKIALYNIDVKRTKKHLKQADLAMEKMSKSILNDHL
ncbi:hypothetical protein ACJOV8_001435 [Formosa sp. 3Alg 14/1]|uniref:hypothetical protein n=1 Tax=Formosa sp. 3Alg 14/1 TaxID=3382190 RepID=UPI0039BE1120